MAEENHLPQVSILIPGAPAPQTGLRQAVRSQYPCPAQDRCWQGWFLLRAAREGAVPGLSPWFVDSHLLPVSFHISFSLRVFASVSKCDTSH